MSNGMGSFGTEFRYRNDETGKLNGNVMKIDFAASAAGYGVKTYRVSSLEELKTAMEDAQKQETSTLIDIKVLPKTMTNGYESWWHVGVAEVSENHHVQEAYKDKVKNLEMARGY